MPHAKRQHDYPAPLICTCCGELVGIRNQVLVIADEDGDLEVQRYIRSHVVITVKGEQPCTSAADKTADAK